LTELREREINRIYGIYINRDIEEKTLKNLNKLLVSLFGRLNAEKIYLKFVRLKQSHEQKVSQNKTFVFSSSKNFSNSSNNKSQNNFTMMLSYASSFRAGGKDDLASTMYVERDRAAEQLSMNRDLAQFEEANGLNNPLEIQNSAGGSLNLSRNNSKDLKKSNLKSPMSKTGTSFNRVKFKEGEPEVNKRGESEQASRKKKGSSLVQF